LINEAKYIEDGHEAFGSIFRAGYVFELCQSLDATWRLMKAVLTGFHSSEILVGALGNIIITDDGGNVTASLTMPMGCRHGSQVGTLAVV
jgi:hypothetical protein